MNMPTVGCVGESIIGNDERGLWFLSHRMTIADELG